MGKGKLGLCYDLSIWRHDLLEFYQQKQKLTPRFWLILLIMSVSKSVKRYNLLRLLQQNVTVNHPQDHSRASQTHVVADRLIKYNACVGGEKKLKETFFDNDRRSSEIFFMLRHER